MPIRILIGLAVLGLALQASAKSPGGYSPQGGGTATDGMLVDFVEAANASNARSFWNRPMIKFLTCGDTSGGKPHGSKTPMVRIQAKLISATELNEVELVPPLVGESPERIRQHSLKASNDSGRFVEFLLESPEKTACQIYRLQIDKRSRSIEEIGAILSVERCDRGADLVILLSCAIQQKASGTVSGFSFRRLFGKNPAN